MPKSIQPSSNELNFGRVTAWSFTISIWALIAAIFLDIQWYIAYWAEPLNSGRDEYLEGVALTAVLSWPPALVALGCALFGRKIGLSSAQRFLAGGLTSFWFILTLSIDLIF